MSEQFRLFGLEGPTWVDRFWRSLDPEARRKVVSILAEMAREAVSRKQPMERKEASRES